MDIPINYNSKISQIKVFREKPANDIVYTLTAEVDGCMIYREQFTDTASLEENGLRKAENAVDEEITEWDTLIREEDGE
jgi:hypothetical protein